MSLAQILTQLRFEANPNDSSQVFTPQQITQITDSIELIYQTTDSQSLFDQLIQHPRNLRELTFHYVPGTYAAVDGPSDTIYIDLDLPLYYITGDGELTSIPLIRGIVHKSIHAIEGITDPAHDGFSNIAINQDYLGEVSRRTKSILSQSPISEPASDHRVS